MARFSNAFKRASGGILSSCRAESIGVRSTHSGVSTQLHCYICTMTVSVTNPSLNAWTLRDGLVILTVMSRFPMISTCPLCSGIGDKRRSLKTAEEYWKRGQWPLRILWVADLPLLLEASSCVIAPLLSWIHHMLLLRCYASGVQRVSAEPLCLCKECPWPLWRFVKCLSCCLMWHKQP